MLKDTKIMDQIETKGLKLQNDLKKFLTPASEWSDTNNPQILWEMFKTDINKWVAQEAKIKHYGQQAKAQKLRKDREEILNNPNLDENPMLQWNELILAKEIEHLEKVMSWNIRECLRAKINWHRERLGGTWSNLSKTRKPRDVILRLKTPDLSPPCCETHSDKMAELAKNITTPYRIRTYATSLMIV